MSAALKLRLEAYLEQERLSETKHEFCDGEMSAMSGASAAHNLMVGILYIPRGLRLLRLAFYAQN